MKESFSIKFYLFSPKNGKEKAQIYLRIIVDREKAEMATKLFIDPKQWNDEAGRANKLVSINDELAEIENEIRRIRRKILDEEKPLSARLVKQFYKGDKNFKTRLLEYFNKHIDELTQFSDSEKISRGTVKNYKVTLKHVSGFINDHKKISDLNINEIDYSFINDFDIYLKTVYTNKLGEKICNNHANKQHSRLRTVLHKAIREGIISSNPYASFRLKSDKTKRDRLTELELRILKNKSFHGNQSLDRVRDFFLFSCYTGLRYEDAYNLKMDDIIKESDGTLAINIVMGKTDDQVYVPILEPARQIIAKYAEDDARKVFNYVLPRYSNQKINVYLKTISELTGINKELTHHVARHTCATFLLNSGVPIEVVQHILGHSDLKTTKIYAKMLNSTVKEEMKKINKKLKAA
jgi:integrase/recombinase XerD